MLLTVIREKFNRNSDKSDLDKCFEMFGMGFIPFTRKFKESELDRLEYPEEQKFNIKNWMIENDKIIWKGE